MRFSSAALAVWLCSKSVTAFPANLYSAFKNPYNSWDVHTTIEFPNSTAFADATQRWNTFSAPTYSVAITPGSEADVARAVRIARSINLPFLGTGGRHSLSTTLGDLDQGLAIDLSRLNSVNVDAKAGTLTIGGGTRFGDIVDPVYEAGYQIPIGSCSCPGMVGATIGGGVGRWQGVNGLIIDSLLSVRLVTADGKSLDVSADANPDLYWAIRGAGANFGIITSATYQLHPQINNGQVLTADFIFPATSNGSYFDILGSLQDGMPAELAVVDIMEYNATTGEAQIRSNWVYIGPEDKGRELIAPLFDLNPTVQSVSIATYNNVVETALFGLGVSICKPVHLKWYGVNSRNLSSPTFQTVFQKLSDFYTEYPDGRASTVELETFAPQAVEAVANDATAYPWRDTRGYSLIAFGWNSTETERAGDAVAKDIRSTMAGRSGYNGLAVYVSYGHGDESLEQLYGSNLPRLTQLKKEWDPDNVFRFSHSLSTNSSTA